MNGHSIPQKRAILYARVSGDDRTYATSGIDSQRAECRAYAAQKGYTVLDEVYEEPNKHTSGYDFLPGLDNILRLAPTRTFDVIVVREMDRFARNKLKRLLTENELRRQGVRVEYVIGQYADTPEGELQKGIMADLAEYERAKIRERTMRGKQQSVVAGNVMIGGSAAPYGYDVERTTDPATGKKIRRLVINEAEAPIVRLIFQLYAVERYSLYGVVDYLSAHQVPKPAKGNNHRKCTTKATWSAGTLASILENETYIGRWAYGKTKSEKDPMTGKTVNRPQPRAEWLEIPCPALIDESLFAAVQEMRRENQHQKSRHIKYEYPLGGMLVCAFCGNRMSGLTKEHKGVPYSYYKCNAHHTPKKYGFKCMNAQFKANQVEQAIWNWIRETFEAPAKLQEALDAYDARQHERLAPQLAMLESNRATRADLMAQQERLIDSIQQGVKIEKVAGRIANLDIKIAELDAALEVLEAEAAPQLLTRMDRDDIERVAQKMRQGLEEMAETKPDRSVFQLLKVEARLGVDGGPKGQRWVEVTCILGDEHLPVPSPITSHRRNHCTLFARLWL